MIALSKLVSLAIDCGRMAYWEPSQARRGTARSPNSGKRLPEIGGISVRMTRFDRVQALHRHPVHQFHVRVLKGCRYREGCTARDCLFQIPRMGIQGLMNEYSETWGVTPGVVIDSEIAALSFEEIEGRPTKWRRNGEVFLRPVRWCPPDVSLRDFKRKRPKTEDLPCSSRGNSEWELLELGLLPMPLFTDEGKIRIVPFAPAVPIVGRRQRGDMRQVVCRHDLVEEKIIIAGFDKRAHLRQRRYLTIEVNPAHGFNDLMKRFRDILVVYWPFVKPHQGNRKTVCETKRHDPGCLTIEIDLRHSKAAVINSFAETLLDAHQEPGKRRRRESPTEKWWVFDCVKGGETIGKIAGPGPYESGAAHSAFNRISHLYHQAEKIINSITPQN